MTSQEYKKIKQGVAILAAALFWVVSIYFSVQGFDMKAINAAWLGLVMGLGITFLEVVGNEPDVKRSMLMVVIVFVAYIYGVLTNFIGILGMQGHTDAMQVLSTDTIRGVLVFVLSLFLEVVPEPMMIFGLTGRFEADFFTTMLRVEQPKDNNNKGGGGQPNQPNKHQQQGHGGGDHGQGHGPRPGGGNQQGQGQRQPDFRRPVSGEVPPFLKGKLGKPS